MLVCRDGQRLDCKRERREVGVSFGKLEKIAQESDNGWSP